MENKDEVYFNDAFTIIGHALKALKEADTAIRSTEYRIMGLVELSGYDYGLEARTVARSMRESAEYLMEILKQERESIIEDSGCEIDEVLVKRG